MCIKKRLIIGILVLTSLFSCGIYREVLNKPYNIELMDKLYKRNGNSFYIETTYSSISIVWSYSEKDIQIYKVLNNKIVYKKCFPKKRTHVWLEQFSGDDLYELDTSIELDGDVFGFKFIENGIKEQHNLPISLQRMLDGEYKSVFLRNVIRDMKIYELKLYEIGNKTQH